MNCESCHQPIRKKPPPKICKTCKQPINDDPNQDRPETELFSDADGDGDSDSSSFVDADDFSEGSVSKKNSPVR